MVEKPNNILIASQSVKNFLKKNMDKNNIDAKISVKTTQLQVEKNPVKRAEYQRDLEILNLRKQIEVLRNKIELKQMNR